MKEWKKPGIVDLDVKFTENMCPQPSGVNPDPTVPSTPLDKPICTKCGHTIKYPLIYGSSLNHKKDCPNRWFD